MQATGSNPTNTNSTVGRVYAIKTASIFTSFNTTKIVCSLKQTLISI